MDSNLFQNISNDIENHCKNIDTFNKDLIANIEKTTNETYDNLLKLLSLGNEQNKWIGQTNKAYNPFSE